MNSDEACDHGRKVGGCISIRHFAIELVTISYCSSIVLMLLVVASCRKWGFQVKLQGFLRYP